MLSLCVALTYFSEEKSTTTAEIQKIQLRGWTFFMLDWGAGGIAIFRKNFSCPPKLTRKKIMPPQNDRKKNRAPPKKIFFFDMHEKRVL